MSRSRVQRLAVASMVGAGIAAGLLPSAAFAWDPPLHGRPPDFEHTDQGRGVWMWVTDHGVLHVRFTGQSADNPQVFSGHLTTDGRFGQITPQSLNQNDNLNQWALKDGEMIDFTFETKARTDGFNVRLQRGQTVSYDFQVNGHSITASNVTFGKREVHPAAGAGKVQRGRRGP